MYEQLEFVFDEFITAPKKKKGSKKTPIDYAMLYRRLLQGPVTFSEVRRLTGVPKECVMSIIDTLSIRYPVWEPSRGIYKLLEESDYD